MNTDEWSWPKVLIAVAEEMQRVSSVRDLVKIVVQAGLRLSFDRARLWQLSDDRQTLIGVCEAGNSGLDDFVGFPLPLAESVYLRPILTSREPIFYDGRDLGLGYLDRYFAPLGFEHPVGEWVTMPLWTGDRLWGALSLDNARQPRSFTQDQRELLEPFGRLIAVALDRIRRYEELTVLNEIGQHVAARAALDDLDTLLLAVREQVSKLIQAHNFMIVLVDQERAGLDFRLHVEYGDIRPRHWRRIEDSGLVGHLIMQNQALLLPKGGQDYRQHHAIPLFGQQSRCWLGVPLWIENTAVGAIVVQNYEHEGAYTEEDQRLLTAVADQVGGAIRVAHLKGQQEEDNRQLAALNRIQDTLLDLNYTVLADIAKQSLKTTLEQICEAARAVMGPDSVILYPLKPHGQPYEYDIANVSLAGDVGEMRLREKPRQKGVTVHILRAGDLVVNDIAEHSVAFGGQRLAEHPFIQRERIRAFIGTPVRDATTGELFGALYLDYRTPQSFTEQVVRQAQSFASLAAMAIRNDQKARGIRSDLAARGKELDVLRRVLEEALAADADEQKVIKALLNAVREVMGRSDIRVGLFLREWAESRHERIEPREARHEYFLHPNGDITEQIEADLFRGISGRALRDGTVQDAADVRRDAWPEIFLDDLIGTRSELDVPIRLGAQVIGVINIESPTIVVFTQEIVAAMERLAASAALALGNVRRHKHLRTLLTALQAVTGPAKLEQTLEAIVEAGRTVAAGLSSLAIWYRDHNDGHFRLGPTYGVRDIDAMAQHEPAEGGLIWEALRARKPIWAAESRQLTLGRHSDPTLLDSESIISTAVLPLWADDEAVGVMLFNYRHHHTFTREEKALFPLLAEIAATSVRDAARLDAISKEQQRLAAALDIAEAVSTTLELDQTLRRIMEKLSMRFPRVRPGILTYIEAERLLVFAQETLDFYVIDNATYEALRSVQIYDEPVACESIAARVARKALASKKAVVDNVGDVLHDASYLPLNSRTRSELCIALMSGEHLRGVLVLESEEAHTFGKDDELLFQGIAYEITLAIDRAYQSAQLRFQTFVSAITAWAGEVAHEINNEIGAIRNWASWILQEPHLSGEGREYIRQIDQSAGRLAGSTKEVGFWQGRQPEPLRLDDWLTNWTRSELAEWIRKRQFVVEMRIAPECPDFLAHVHPVVLGRVLRHLARNAVRAMDGAGTLTIRTRPSKDDQVELQVEDTGPGIPENLRPILFKQPIIADGQQGGLGLLLVRLYVETMGGSIRLLPQEPGRGAVFAITLPVALASTEGVI